MRIYPPTVILREEYTIYGSFYKPINDAARHIAGVIGTSMIPRDRLDAIRELGFRIEFRDQEVAPPRLRR